MGRFTLPGESGYEGLTLELAKRWGADVIRDSDGTTLSDEILSAGYGVYSTICPIREHNEWIKENPDARQQTFLCTAPRVAESGRLTVRLMDDFFEGQFAVNDTPDGLRYWQVYDRTENAEVPRENWRYNRESGEVIIDSVSWRQYTVSFLAWRIWEEISMYNHVTNSWDKEHLMQLDPYHAGAREYLKKYMADWCVARPHTTVVRFTSLFYNFVWIWGADERNRHRFTDWASYDFTVCPAALDDFEKKYGYALRAEDFVRQGKYNATHRVPGSSKRDWMEFIGGFVREASRELIDIVHEAGKKAYVFYDDSWVGMEPYNGHFEEFGFDGIIKCVFSGFEVRLCANVPAETHEIRFHPYLFPVGLGGLPTFSPGGHPGKDALDYWVSARRALLRQRIERCGLGGYLHLVEGYPDFVEAMDKILEEFQKIGDFHESGAPYALKPRIGILHAWGSLRTWTLSGHFHETYMHRLIHVLESLSGTAFDVSFLSFDDVRGGVPEGIDVILNAGDAGDAWSGGDCWKDNRVVETLTEWVHKGGVFMGIGEPSATDGYHTSLRMAHVLGVDIDKGEYACHGRWAFDVKELPGLLPEGFSLPERSGVLLTDGKANVYAANGASPTLTINAFGKGKGVYLSGFAVSSISTRMLQNLLLYAASGSVSAEGVTDNPLTECAVYPQKLVFVNNSDEKQCAGCFWKGREYRAELPPYGMEIIDI